jgi:hypothetical protein
MVVELPPGFRNPTPSPTGRPASIRKIVFIGCLTAHPILLHLLPWPPCVRRAAIRTVVFPMGGSPRGGDGGGHLFLPIMPAMRNGGISFPASPFLRSFGVPSRLPSLHALRLILPPLAGRRGLGSPASRANQPTCHGADRRRSEGHILLAADDTTVGGGFAHLPLCVPCTMALRTCPCGTVECGHAWCVFRLVPRHDAAGLLPGTPPAMGPGQFFRRRLTMRPILQ